MEITFKNCLEYKNGTFAKADNISVAFDGDGASVSIFDSIIIPAFCDVHVHLREPGFFYKETIHSGTMAAAHGGYTDVFSMPNLDPVPDSVSNIKRQIDIIKKDAVIRVHPYASITVGQMGEALSDFDGLAELCIAFSDDGRGVQSREMMKSAMLKAKEHDMIIVAHCEDNSLLNGGYIHDGEYARKNGHRGICSESEWGPIKRDLELAKETGCKYHVCHVSCKESVELIRKAKASGVDVTCETAPHYLVLDDSALQEDGRFKMNPPLRDKSDRLALIEGLKDGTIDMIATDHAPHSDLEKSRGLEKSSMGVVGLETAFPVLYTELVKTNVITLERLIELMSINPRVRFKLPMTDDICVFNLNEEYVINPDEFLTKGRSTPFKDKKVFGKCVLTVCDKKVVYC